MEAAGIPHIKLENIKKGYNSRSVLEGLNLTIRQGEFVAIVGRSGCGKSTLLRLLAGLEFLDTGSILVDGEEINSLNKNARLMFQDGRLLPWKKVMENVSMGLPRDHRLRALNALERVGLKDRANDWPARLSGGQKQRVALARALVHNPAILLLDEPLGALDALTRLEMQRLVEQLWSEKKFTSILVTHDVEEAVALADRVILIEEGSIKLDQYIPLPRPRQRVHPGFSLLVEEILQHITGPGEGPAFLGNQRKRVY
ncbi:ATP-binding cassette domain-containing protein [Peribacillus kribbensis]|uniref:ATP-binding cassette domain-containing protein n=1 Tax=Peribacillus kribbensis TaxID=356658 RepID=UPI0003F98A45|nr:ATP-binding cassette domain-containing protein [Peribacillus kribbensis]